MMYYSRLLFFALLYICFVSHVFAEETKLPYKLTDRFHLDLLSVGKVSETHGIGLDLDESILITDPIEGNVFRYSKKGAYLESLGLGKGGSDEAYDGPRDVQVDRQGRIFVVEGNKNKILRIDPNGEILVTKSEFGDPGQLNRPHSIGIHPSGNLYVADVEHGRIAVFDSDLNYLFDWQLDSVTGEARGVPHGVRVGPEGNVFVVDYNGIAYKYTPQGKLLFSFANVSGTYHALCIGRDGYVFLTARHARARGAYLDVYRTADGSHQGIIQIEHDGEVHPVCCAVSSNGTLYVTDDRGVDVLVPEKGEVE